MPGAALVLIAGLAACSLPREPGEAQAAPTLAALSRTELRSEAGSAEDASASAPEPTVATLPAPPRTPRSPFAFANDDPADDFVVAPPDPRPDCEAALTAAGVKFARAKIPVHQEGKGHAQLTCGAEQVVLYRGSASGISFSPSPILTCTMALALARFEVVVQEEAARTFGEQVARITQLGTYSCREMAAYRGWVSEHAYANAIDVESFVFKSGRRVSVLQGFERGDDTRTRAGAFLRAVSRRAYDEEIFSNVLTPFFDELHRNHFHLDLARYRNDGTRPLEETP
ncbi:MAG TPA: extensin family protein [Polyangiaceae bacterium]|jgi:hypothetical protein